MCSRKLAKNSQKCGPVAKIPQSHKDDKFANLKSKYGWLFTCEIKSGSYIQFWQKHVKNTFGAKSGWATHREMVMAATKAKCAAIDLFRIFKNYDINLQHAV